MFVVSQAIAHCDTPYHWQKAEANEDDIDIVVLRINNYTVSESIDLYPFKQTHLIPISQLGGIFDLPWQVQIEPARFWSEYRDHDALCDFDIHFKQSDNSETRYWYADDFDTYIDVRMIAELLDGTQALNYQLLQLNFTSKDKTIGAKNSTNTKTPNDYFYRAPEVYPIVTDRYQLFSIPLINFRTNVNYNDQTKNLKHRSNLNAFFDFAYTSAEYRLGLSNENESNFLKFSKNFDMNINHINDYRSIHSIQDKAIKYEIGDVVSEGDELVGRSTEMLGVNMFSHSQNHRRSFSSIRIEETILPGWRGLLFRNGQFIAEAESGDNNLLVFSDVQTFFGSNRFEIRLFGPEGQEETRHQVISVGQQQLSPGEFDFRLLAGDATRRLLDGYVGKGDFSKQYMASASVGVTTNSILSVDLQRFESATTTNTDYVTLGMDVNIGENILRMKHANQIEGGHANLFSLHSKVSNSLQTRLRHVYLDDFESQKYRNTETRSLKRETSVNINKRLALSKPLNVSLNFSERRFTDASSSTNLSVKASHNFRSSTFSNTFTQTKNTNNERITHDAFLSHSIGNWRLSHSLKWQPFHNGKIESYNANIRWPQTLKTFGNSTLKYQRSKDARLDFSHRVNFRTDFMNIQLGGSVNNNGDWTAQLSISGDLFYNKPKRRLNMSRPKGSETAEINAFAFIDTNRDGIFNNNDETLPEVSFLGRSSWKNQTTADNGQAQLFSSQRYQKVEIDKNSLFDPFISPINDAFIVNTHAGGGNQVAFPMIVVNDIEGTVVVSNGEESRGFAGAIVTLLSLGSGDYFQSKTENDGFFFFTKIPPGRYKLKLDRQRISNANLTMPTDEIIVVAPEEGDIVTLDEIELLSKVHREANYMQFVSNYADTYSGIQRTAFLSLKSHLDNIIRSIKKENKLTVNTRLQKNIDDVTIANITQYSE